MAGPWKYDPVAYFFIDGVGDLLRKSGHEGVNLDLLERLKKVDAKSKEQDNSLATTDRRISWCCYVAADMVLEMLEHPKPPVPPALRPPLTMVSLTAMEKVFEDIDHVADIDTAEYLMVDDEQKRKAAQLWAEKTKKLKAMALQAQRLVFVAKEYKDWRGSDDAAAVGDAFVTFLVKAERPRDDMVGIAECLVEIHL
jgi:nucleoid-associated protein YgaU